MICPQCSRQLRVSDTRQFSPTSRYREYICFDCKSVFISTENLDKEPMNKRPRSIEKIISRIKNNSSKVFAKREIKLLI